MKLKSRTIIIFLQVYFIIFCSIYAQKTIDYNKLDDYIANAVKESQSPGFAVGIIKDDKIVFAKGYGVRSAETKIPVDSQTQFCLGSCSKAFTAAALGILADEGRLNWDDKIVNHLPWFRLHDAYITKELTIGDLLCHRSGLGTFDGDLLWFGTHYSSEEVVRRIKELPVKNGFRSQFGYQNVMFIAAGLIVETVSGKPWHEFVRERILKPLEMNNSSTNLADFKSSANIAIPHFEGKPLAFISYDSAGPAAAVNSSVEDMLKWLKMWINNGKIDAGQFLSLRTIGKMTSSQMFLSAGPGTGPMGTHFNNYGYGWRLIDYAGRKVILHGGGLPGYLSQVVFVPEERLGIVILVNDLTPIHDSISNKILDLFMTDVDKDYVNQTLAALKQYKPMLEKQRQERLSKKIADTSPSLKISDYTGLYRDKMYGDAEIAIKEGMLVLTFLPAKELLTAQLEHFHYDTFKFQFDVPTLEFGLITFYLNSTGQVQDFTIDLPCRDFDFSGLKFVKLVPEKEPRR
jgi:CubicO group peptidase (beta-lactamase class C family)